MQFTQDLLRQPQHMLRFERSRRVVVAQLVIGIPIINLPYLERSLRMGPCW